MAWFVYILKSLRDDTYYVGCSSDVEKRLSQHNKGYNKSTQRHTPYVVIHVESYLSQQEAFSREKKIKSYKGGEALKRLIARRW